MKFWFVIVCFISCSLWAQSGTLKTDFGQNGKLSLDIDDLDDLVGILKDDQGNNYLYGNTSDNLGGVYPYDFFFAKMNEFGELDLNFGTDGIFRADFPGFSTCSVNKAYIHSTGIFFIGQGINSTSLDTFALFVSKITLDGEIDTNFANSGFYTQDFLGTYNTAGSILVDTEDKVVFCGSTTDDQGTLVEYPILGRLELNGDPDSTFGTTGIIAWDYYAGSLVDLMYVENSNEPSRHGDGMYLTEIVEVNNAYFATGKFQGTANTELNYMSIGKDGLFNPNFLTTGPYIYQLDPGYNHSVSDIEYLNSSIYLSLYTDGSLYGGKHLIQKLDTTGVQQDLLVFEQAGYDLRVNYLEGWNNKLFYGGYHLDQNNAGPGYFSDDFSLNCLDQTDQPIQTFNFIENMSSSDELGAKGVALHANYGILGGFMNNLVGQNYTDIALMAFDLNSNLTIEESSNEFHFYPNPTDGILNFAIPVNGNYQITDVSGKLISEGEISGNQLDLSHLASGTYFLRLNEEQPIPLIRY